MVLEPTLANIPGCFIKALVLHVMGGMLRRSARTVRDVTTSDCVCLVLPGCSAGVSAEQVLLLEARHSLHFLACHAGSTCTQNRHHLHASRRKRACLHLSCHAPLRHAASFLHAGF